MADDPIVAQLPLFPDGWLPPKPTRKWPDLHTFWQQPERLPEFVRTSPTVMRNLELLGPLDWDHFPERNLERHWGQSQIPFAALVAAELLKLNDGRASWTDLRRYLVEHPGFIWLLGFPLVPAPNDPLGFNAQASLPTHRHLVRMLRQVPNAALQFLLADSVRLILTELASLGLAPPECVSLDTKHTRSVAWVKENNPKTYVPDRFNKTKPPPGDPDCRLAPPAPSHAGTGNTASSGARTSRRPASCACCRLTASLAPNAKPTVIASS